MLCRGRSALRTAIQNGRRYSTKQKVIFLDEKQLEALGRDELGQVPAAEHIETMLSESQEPYMRRSPEALFGKKRIGHVELPKQINKTITDFMNSRPDNHIVRTDALKMFAALRNYEIIGEDSDTATKKKRQLKKSVEPQTLTYGPRETVAYTVGLAPANYGPIYNILRELSNRLSDFDPRSMLDFGTGPGTAIWAAKEVFPNIKDFTGVDISEDMIKMAEYIEENLRQSADKTEKCVQFRRYMEMNPKVKKPDLVVSSYTLSEVPSPALRKSVVEQLWEQTDDILILIDRGNPAGFERIATARQMILDRDEDVHVVSPCPHDAPCPMLFSLNAKPSKSWCHFSQRIQRPSFLMKTKHAKSNIEDAKYSYVVLRRGKRPSSTATAETSSSSMEIEAYQWPRLILPPRKNPRHVVLDVCSRTGEIQRMTIPKSQGKIPYRDARKAMWGDLYPHPPKTKIVTRISKAEPLEEKEESIKA